MSKIYYNRIPAFILLYGVFAGVVFSLNLLLVGLIGYGAIFTQLIILFYVLLYFIKIYERFIKTDLKIILSVLIGFPTFFLTVATCAYFYDFYSQKQYTAFGIREEMVRGLEYAFFITIILSFIFLPIYRRKKNRLC